MKTTLFYRALNFSLNQLNIQFHWILQARILLRVSNGMNWMRMDSLKILLSLSILKQVYMCINLFRTMIKFILDLLRTSHRGSISIGIESKAVAMPLLVLNFIIQSENMGGTTFDLVY